MHIASLLPSATEIICDLGLESQLIAVSHACDRPTGVTHLPVLTRSIIGYDLPPAEIDRAVSAAMRQGTPLYTVRAELLEQLAPDLIVTQGVCEVCAVTPRTIEEAVQQITRYLPDCLPVNGRLLSLEGRTLEGILADVCAVALAAGVPERGEALTRRAAQRWQEVKAVQHAPKVLTLEWTEPPFTGGHWVPEQVERAGGVNAFGTPGHDSCRSTWETIEASDPDVIVVMCCGYGLEENAGFASNLLGHAQASKLRAVRQGQLWAVDANAHFSRPALGVVRGAEVLADLLRGQALPGESVQVGV
ncbi:ABC transporter substrate-binding protein [Deinococcus sp.]|uniref:ABC transporter substrate-binding protein n=1 Tax=Deinococcus sp. TaxID=47478 RepID=UPI00286D6F8E|nr:ABC transporter substrate-binding protein [Deinococcus sp.]